MKRFKFLTCFGLLFLLGVTVVAQDNTAERLNLPGDNLNLYAVMKLFQDSETLEGFEKNLNAEDTKINNLDLNGDDKIDYIKVIDNVNGIDHTIVLQVAVNDKENQDVAVFTVHKDADNNVQIQLIGDEELYGKDYIIEPSYADNTPAGETPNPGYTTNSRTVDGKTVTVVKTSYVEVQTWPVVRYIYMPTYVRWHSPWYWGYYPSYWNPWRPYYWDYYYGYQSNWNRYYYRHYRPAHVIRYAHWNDHYYNNHRSYSNTVYQHRESGAYRNTYSRPETRQQGSADYLKQYPNRDRANTRNSQGVNRQDSRQGVNQPQERRNNNNSNVRTGTNRPVNSGNVNTRNGNNENRTKSQPAVNTRSERPANSSPAVKSEKRQPTPRQENTRRSAEPQKSVKSSETRSERKAESKSVRESNKNSEKAPNKR